MKKILRYLSSMAMMALGVASIFPTLAAAQVTTNSSCSDPNYIAAMNTVYRRWNPNLVDHFYTNNPQETGTGYSDEQTTWGVENTQLDNTIPLYRFYSNSDTDHFYSTTAATPNGYVSEGMIGFIFPSTVPGSTPLYRLYRYYNGNGDHLYTTSASERDAAMNMGYHLETTEGYVCIK